MKLKDFINPLLKWWWLIIIATVVAGMSGYIVMRPKPPIYQARTTLFVGTLIYTLNPNGNEFQTAVDLAEAYADIANRAPVQDATKAALGLPVLPTYVAQAIPDSTRVQILVTDINPQRAQAVANELANQLIKHTPSGSQQDPQQTAFINQQLDDLQTQIKKTQADINTKQNSLVGVTSASQIQEIQDQINTLNTRLDLLQTNYTTLLDNTQRGATNSLTVIEPASLPNRPIGPNKPAIILLVTLAGFVLSSGAAHLIEYLDRTIKTPEDVERVLNLPVLGFIGDIKGKNSWSHVADHPRSPAAEAFRTLRTNIEFASVDRPLKTLLVTSADTGEGKTTIATNLAMMIAQGENRVILIDADMRRPSIHKLLGVPISPGLSEVFRDRVTIFDAMRAWRDKNLVFITSGNPPPNPTELLDSHKMEQILASIEDVVGTIVLDAPPFLVADASVLAAKVDGVLLVIRAGETREEEARAMIEQIRRTGARVIGVALNFLPRRGTGYYGYRYYSGYSSEIYDNDGKEKTLKKGIFSGS